MTEDPQAGVASGERTVTVRRIQFSHYARFHTIGLPVTPFATDGSHALFPDRSSSVVAAPAAGRNAERESLSHAQTHAARRAMDSRVG